jgi:hypothetical protein
MPEREIRISQRFHIIDISDLNPVQVNEQFLEATGTDMDMYLDQQVSRVQRECSVNCCCGAQCARNIGIGSIIFAECRINKPGCQERTNELFQEVSDKITEVFGKK